MNTNIDYDTLDRSAQLALQSAAATAAANLASGLGGGDELVVLRKSCPAIPGEQDDDGVRAVASIDVLRALVADYEATA